jgi:hypothetical protein
VASNVAPNNVATSDPSSELARVDWLNRPYRIFEGSFGFSNGSYTDSERVLHVAPPVYLDVTGDGVIDALVPLQIDEAETAIERGNPRFHAFLVFSIVNANVVHLGELPMMTCGPLRAELDGDWLRITSTRRGQPDDMCGGTPESRRYRWNGTWFVDEEGVEAERKLP